MNHITSKRVLKDISDLEKNNLTTHGIYYNVNEENIFNIKVLMIGPQNTPYQHGYYFFDINIPDDYPFKPPNVKYCTQNNKTRFNPNLYINGKVCLSILNTWSGPQWTSCNNLTTILLSIQSMVFIENPLHNEPGFENNTSIKNKNYNHLITYENFNTAIYNMILNVPSPFKYFLPIMTKLYIDNYDNIIKQIDENIYNDNKLVECNIYQMKDTLHYSKVKTAIRELYKKIINK